MLRIFELADLHFDPRWADVLEKAVDAVEAEAERNRPDLIALPGDLHNRPLYAADRSGYSRLLGIVRRLLEIAPVAAIEGTPSHDAPGSYAPLEELGLVLLKPGRVYRLFPGEIVDVMNTGPQAAPPLAVLFGIPELNKDGAEALDADARAGNALEAWNNYIDEFIAPHRASFPELPAVALLHGVVSDAERENETDIIKKSSSLVLHTGDMARAGINRWILGDIHTPWESERISAGYAGFVGVDDNPWGKIGFVTGFNVTTIDLSEIPFVNIFSIPYGTPERIKITAPLDSYNPAIAYWLDSAVDDPDLDPRKQGAHPWSRMTYEPKKETTRRVTKEAAEKAQGAGDLLALMMPDEATERRREIADSIDAAAAGRNEPRNISLNFLRVAGASFFGGKTITLDMEEIQDGLTAITGDNGAGKSSLLAFCSPYPVVIGKDTESGRASAIKEFFTEPESYIDKLFMVNGIGHRHLVTIKGAHTKSPKVECFLYIDEKNVLETTNFDAMLAKCEELYGPLEDYLRTYQYVQPQQGGAPSGLMSAGAVELRNVVQNIAGIDRSQERRAALDKSNEIERESDRISDQVNGMILIAEDPAAIATRISSLQESHGKLKREIESLETTLDSARTIEAEADAAFRNAEIEGEKLAEHRRSLNEARKALGIVAERIRFYEKAIEVSASAREELKADAKAQALLDQWKEDADEINSRNETREKGFAQGRADYSEKILVITEIKNRNDRKNRDFEEATKTISSAAQTANEAVDAICKLSAVLAQPCEACGHISAENQLKVKVEKQKGNAEERKESDLRRQLAALLPPEQEPVPEFGPEPTQPPLEELPAMPPDCNLDTSTRADLNNTIKLAETAETILPEIRRELEEKNLIKDDLEKSLKESVDLEPFRDASMSATATRRDIEGRWRVAMRDGESAGAQIETATEAHSKALRVESDIKAAKEKVETLVLTLDDWRWVAAMMAPAKLPAFELELVLDSIDDRATRNITPFREGRYRIRTETQREGADGRVDKFQVVLSDGEIGTERSFLKHSPGEKAFIALAYQRALIAEREDRTGVTYSPHVLDEADGPVQPARVPEFYAMQSETVGNGRALVVSHAPDAQYYIGNTIAIEELMT